MDELEILLEIEPCEVHGDFVSHSGFLHRSRSFSRETLEKMLPLAEKLAPKLRSLLKET